MGIISLGCKMQGILIYKKKIFTIIPALNGAFWFTDETVSHIIYVTKFHVMKHEEGNLPWKTES